MKWFLLKKLFGLNVLTDRMKTSSQSPAPGSTASHQGVRVQLPLSPLWETGFLFCSPVTRSSRTRVNTSAVFLHQSSSFLIEVHVFDIVSCMQKAHWYCEWITVNVIDSFIFIFFFSVFVILMFCYHQISLHCLLQVLSVLRPTQFGCHVFSIFAQFAGKISSFLFLFLNTCYFSMKRRDHGQLKVTISDLSIVINECISSSSFGLVNWRPPFRPVSNRDSTLKGGGKLLWMDWWIFSLVPPQQIVALQTV